MRRLKTTFYIQEFSTENSIAMKDFGKFVSPVVEQFEALQRGTRKRYQRSAEGHFSYEKYDEGAECMTLEDFDIEMSAKFAAYFDHCALTFSIIGSPQRLIYRPPTHRVFSYKYYEEITVPRPGAAPDRRVLNDAENTERGLFFHTRNIPLLGPPVERRKHRPEIGVALRVAGFVVRGQFTNACVLDCKTSGGRSAHRIKAPGEKPLDNIARCTDFPPANTFVTNRPRTAKVPRSAVPCFVCGATNLRAWEYEWEHDWEADKILL
jgi:hypothetical protein